MSVKNHLINNVVAPALMERNPIKTIAKVLSSNDKQNTCDIQIVDKNGKVSNKDNVPVVLYGNGTDWFPSKDDKVIVEIMQNQVIIIARYVDNYAAEVRTTMELKEDVYSDNSGAQRPGGQIM